MVDDNASKRLALTAVIEPLGFSIVEADSGQAALRCLLVQNFAVILLDVRMPIMDGFETAALIRLRQQSEMTPIIFITAHAQGDVVDFDRYAEGAVDFMCAPVAPEELRAKVSVFANLYLRAEALATQAREVQASADQLRLLADAAPIGIFQTDAANRYIYTNPRWTEITGVSAPDAVGQAWDSIIGPDQRTALDAALAVGPASNRELGHRLQIERAGADPRIVLVTSKAMPDQHGDITGWVGTLADVTAEAGAEAAMAEATAEAKRASQLKSDFLANMSHEIRTPMNGVIGMTDLLLKTDLDARQRDFAQTVRNSGEALLTVINDVLDFSKVEAGKLEVEHIEFNVRSIVHDVVDLLASPAQIKGLELVPVVEEGVPAIISGDPGRIRQVLTNLIGNAIKFTATGEVVVGLTYIETAGASPAVVRFEVSDTGDGIAPDKLAHIFQPFVQADTSTSRRYGGTGLGLAICSQLVALMGGDCGVRSQFLEGSTFWFTIPVPGGTRRAAPDRQAPDVDLIDVSVLIVDDSDTQRTVLSTHLVGWGMTSAAAASGPAALATLRTAAVLSRPFDVAVIDRSMPGMDGLALSRAILRDTTLSTRVVLLTGLGQDRDLGEPAESGISASLSKPIRHELLHTAIRVALGLERAAETPADEVASPPTERRQIGRLLLAEDNLINQKITVAMLSSVGYHVDTVLNGAEALQAVADHAYDAILMDCHMPEVDGYEAAAAIRRHEGSTRRTPIIAMSTGARQQNQDRCLAEGMDSYLTKPVNKEALLSMVAKAVKQH